MSDYKRIHRKSGKDSFGYSSTPAKNPLKTRGFGKGMQARSAELPTTNLLQTRPAKPPTPQPTPLQETPDLDVQLKQAEGFGYNGLDVPTFAAGATPPPTNPSLMVMAKLVNDIKAAPIEETSETQTIQREEMSQEDESELTSSPVNESEGSNIEPLSTGKEELGESESSGKSETPHTLPIQAKLTIGEANDPYEQEADRVAAQVVQRIHAPETKTGGEGQVQRQEMGEDEEVKRKSVGESIQRVEISQLNAKSDSGNSAEASAELEGAIEGARGGGQPLDESVKEPMEREFGADFSGVRVHTDTQADELNQAIQAKAFTTGQDVFFREGAYDPGSQGGQDLLAHELTHVVQQKGLIEEGEKEGVEGDKERSQEGIQKSLTTKGEALAGIQRCKIVYQSSQNTTEEWESQVLKYLDFSDIDEKRQTALLTALRNKLSDQGLTMREIDDIKNAIIRVSNKGPIDKNEITQSKSVRYRDESEDESGEESDSEGSSQQEDTEMKEVDQPQPIGSESQDKDTMEVDQLEKGEEETGSQWQIAPPGKRVGEEIMTYDAAQEKVENLKRGLGYAAAMNSEVQANAYIEAMKDITSETLQKENALKQFVQRYKKIPEKNLNTDTASKVLNLFKWILPIQREQVKGIDGKQGLLQTLKMLLEEALSVLEVEAKGSQDSPLPRIPLIKMEQTKEINNLKLGVKSAIRTSYWGALYSGEKSTAQIYIDDLNKNLSPTRFISGHLVADTIGGKDDARNYTPITEKFNTSNEGMAKPENLARNKLKDRKVIEYETTVEYGNETKTTIEAILPTSMEITIKEMVLKQNGDSQNIEDWEPQQQGDTLKPQIQNQLLL